MESESGTNKVSDSGYSNSCSNSQSQRSGSSKSRNSGSSRSSGYGCHPTNRTVTCSIQPVPQPISKRNKDKEHKKKKLKNTVIPVEKPSETPSGDKVPEVPISAGESETKPVAEPAVVALLIAPLQDCQVVTVTEAPLTTPQAAESAHIDVESWPESEGEAKPVLLAEPEVAPEDMETADDPPEVPVDNVSVQNLCQPEDGFCCVISMYDGVVLYTTPGLTPTLGFPKDLWLGRSFIEFVHPKDRDVFATRITSGLPVPFTDATTKQKDTRNTLFVNLRKHRELKPPGLGVIDRSASYQPFHLTITFRQVNDQNNSNADDSKGMFLIVVAVPVHAIYKVPDENCTLSKFSTRHTANCVISHVDQDVVSNFGFFPQDMIGRCIFDFYHPGDMPLLREIYGKVMEKCKQPGALFKSKPYRFLVQNGEYATVETEWTSFVNPWTKKLEIVINHHQVIQGPSNPNVFDKPKENRYKNISCEVIKRSKFIRDEITLLLNQLVQLDSARQQVSQRCKDMASYMETLMDVSRSHLKIDICEENNTSISVSSVKLPILNGITSQPKERDSVMLGEISPHHDYSDSKSSTETPPSYNQLNYNENIERFFQSKPTTTVSDEMNGPLQSSTDTDQEGKSSSAVQSCNNQKCLSPVHGSGASGSGSGGNLSSESNPQMENGTTSGTGTNTSHDSYKSPHLTEALLLQHNEVMEKIMVKRHRDHRSITKSERDREGKKRDKNLITSNTDKQNQHQTVQGVKRSGSYSWEGDNHKVSKHQHQDQPKPQTTQESPVGYTSIVQCSNMQNNPTMQMAPNKNIYQPTVDSMNMNLWTPFSVTVTPIHTTQPCTSGIVNSSAPGYATGMFPAVCYIPTHTGQTSREYPGSPVSGQFHVQYMPSMMYPTMFGASPMLYSPMTMMQPMTMPVPQPQPQPMNTCESPTKETNLMSNKPCQGPNVPNKGLFQRPASQATSVKAEPGSVLESIASASVANRAMSECSRKDLALQSVCSPDFLMVSPQVDDTVVENSNGGGAKVPEIKSTERDVNQDYSINDEESSYSSFYSSFLKTDAGSNEDNNNSESKHRRNKDQSERWQKPRSNPIIRKPDPPWLDDVNVTPELIYRYQMAVKGVEEILKSDLNTLREINQPDMVNDQLDQLYLEMELEGLSAKLTLEDGMTSSSSSGDESVSSFKPKKKRRSYSQLVMIYEEDAPLPPPPT